MTATIRCADDNLHRGGNWWWWQGLQDKMTLFFGVTSLTSSFQLAKKHNVHVHADEAGGGGRHASHGDASSHGHGLLLGPPGGSALPGVAGRPRRRRRVPPLPPRRARARRARRGPVRGVTGALLRQFAVAAPAPAAAARGAARRWCPRGQDGAGVRGDAGSHVLQRRRAPRRRRGPRRRVPPRAERRAGFSRHERCSLFVRI